MRELDWDGAEFRYPGCSVAFDRDIGDAHPKIPIARCRLIELCSIGPEGLGSHPPDYFRRTTAPGTTLWIFVEDLHVAVFRGESWDAFIAAGGHLTVRQGTVYARCLPMGDLQRRVRKGEEDANLDEIMEAIEAVIAEAERISGKRIEPRTGGSISLFETIEICSQRKILVYAREHPDATPHDLREVAWGTRR